MKIAIGNDRKGLQLKRELVPWLEGLGHEVVNVGTDTDVPCDYPIFAEKAARAVVSGRCDRGIVICSTGVGIAIAANKVKGVRCGLAYDDEVTKLMRQHNDANMVAFGQSFMSVVDAKRRMEIFLETEFLGSYHKERLELIRQIEENEG